MITVTDIACVRLSLAHPRRDQRQHCLAVVGVGSGVISS